MCVGHVWLFFVVFFLAYMTSDQCKIILLGHSKMHFYQIEMKDGLLSFMTMAHLTKENTSCRARGLASTGEERLMCGCRTSIRSVFVPKHQLTICSERGVHKIAAFCTLSICWARRRLRLHSSESQVVPRREQIEPHRDAPAVASRAGGMKQKAQGGATVIITPFTAGTQTPHRDV